MSILIRQDIPIYISNPAQWEIDLKNFILTNILQKILKDPNIINPLISDENMRDVWIPVFTHQSFDPENNYETFEKIGDNVMETVFSYKLKSRVPQITPEQLTNMINTYLSSKYQGDFAQKRGWDKYVRTRFVSNIKLAEDLVEAIFGGLYFAGENLLNGVGNILASGLIDHFMEGIPFDLSASVIKDPEIIIKEIFKEYLGLPVPRLIENHVNGIWTAELKLDIEAQNFLNLLVDEVRKNTPGYTKAYFSDVLARTINKSRKTGMKEAYRQAVELLASYGFDSAWAKSAKIFIRLLKDPLLKAVVDKANQNGYVTIETSGKIMKGTTAYMALYGIDREGKKKRIDEIIVDGEYTKRIVELLYKKYLNQLEGVKFERF